MSQKIHNMVRYVSAANVELEAPVGFKLFQVVPLPPMADENANQVNGVLYVFVEDALVALRRGRKPAVEV